MKNIDETLKKIVQRHLEPARIINLKSKVDEDHYGDPILNISIVFKAKNDLLDPEKCLSLARQIREPLSEFQSDIYPVFYFMTPEEVDLASS